jgi:hypothetical protein
VLLHQINVSCPIAGPGSSSNQVSLEIQNTNEDQNLHMAASSRPVTFERSNPTQEGPSDGKCALCGLPEDVDHIFFQCILAKFRWSGLRSMFRVNWNPQSREDWFGTLDGFNTKLKKFCWFYLWPNAGHFGLLATNLRLRPNFLANLLTVFLKFS